jgi:hypothetical protein
MRKALRSFGCAGAMLILLTAAAAAQGINMGTDGVSFSPFAEQPKKPLTKEEVDKQRQLDDAYKSATNKIPDQRSNDPWAVVRPTAPTPAPKKKPQQ